MNEPTTLFGFPTDTVNATAGAVTAAAAVWAACYAMIGISAWREETRGRRKAELAEEVLASFYEAEEQIRWIRFPVTLSGEAADRPRRDDETPDQARRLDMYYPAISRMREASEFFSTFFALKHRFRAVFGEEEARPFQEIKTVHAEIRAAYSSIARIIADRELGECMPEPSQRVWDRSVDRIWEDNGDPDPIKGRVATAVRNIEAVCRPAIEARAK